MLDDAAGVYQGILALNREDDAASNALIAIYLKKKRYNDLIEFLKEGTNRNPDDPSGHYKLGIVYEYTKNYQDAAAEYQKALEKKSNHAKALNALGRLYLKTGRLDEAKQMLLAAKKADPSLKETTLMLKNIHEEFRPKTTVKKKKQHRKKHYKKKRSTKKKYTKKRYSKKKSAHKKYSKKKSAKKKQSAKKSRAKKKRATKKQHATKHVR
jgi:tetratricopeptide (TPR) repeat protein